MDDKNTALLEKMLDPEEKEAYFFADKLGKNADEETRDRLLELIQGNQWESAYLACRALAQSEFADLGLQATLEAVFDKRNKGVQGAFVQVLEHYNLEHSFVDVLKIYLFGNFKASQLAESYLNEVEFDITPRTIRKAEKHWKHYLHNPEDEGSTQIKRDFVEPMLQEMRDLFSE
ncbi:HEAT repeat domain-containing protein [Algoriphagus namhaensis]